MKGTITVTSAGTAAPRPGAGSGSGPPLQSSPASADTVAPTTSVKVLDSKRSTVRKRRSLQLAVKTDEAATLAITARSGSTTVASGSARLNKAGTRKVTVKLTKAGLKRTVLRRFRGGASALGDERGATPAKARRRLPPARSDRPRRRRTPRAR